VYHFLLVINSKK